LKNDVSQIRRDYAQRSLSSQDVSGDPLKQLQQWLDEAIRAEALEPTAMTLATVDRRGRPAARTVLLKEFDEKGVVFYTNYNSRKAHHLLLRPFAALTLFWPELERQVRLEGRVQKVGAERSDSYFFSRPYKSQLGAWVSDQSAVIPGRQQLEDRMERVAEQFKNQPMQRPPYWGGYLLIPDRVEFWQGRRSRLHDRLEFIPDGQSWKIQRLSP
jgi:pyridoxamine 5'-phosphate oxidase